jgi:hypothetical protein
MSVMRQRVAIIGVRLDFIDQKDGSIVAWKYPKN